jgi:hypothetical protein
MEVQPSFSKMLMLQDQTSISKSAKTKEQLIESRFYFFILLREAILTITILLFMVVLQPDLKSLIALLPNHIIQFFV